MNKKNILTIIVFLSFTVLNAQKTSNDHPASVQINLGRSFSGTGDTMGFHFGFVHTNNFANKFNWFLGLEGTLHDDESNQLFFEDSNGKVANGTLHDVTGGLQLLAGIAYNFIHNTHHDFGIGLGAVFRYQATSINDIIYTFYPVATGFPVPVRVIINEEKQRTYSPGGTFRIHYNYKINNKYFVGFTGGTQFDTNDDVISYATLNIGFLL